jgi:hypothetical protein
VFVALGMQHAMRMRHIVICGLSGSTVFFPILAYKEQDILKKVIERRICVSFSAQLLSEIFLVLRRTERDMIKNVD